jgi:hypothetical protein
MSSFVSGFSSSHWERGLLPANNNSHSVVQVGRSSYVLPVPSNTAPGPRQLLTNTNCGPQIGHYVHDPYRSINRRLAVEILTHIFLYAIDTYRMTPCQLVAICRHWRNVINGITSLWSTLHLGTWTEIEKVNIWLERSKQSPLTVRINPQRDINKCSSGPPCRGLQHAFISMDRWKVLAIASFPTPEVFGGEVHFLTAKTMDQLTSLEVGEKCSHPTTLIHLLDHISKTAISLRNMSLLVPSAIFVFLQPQGHHILNSVITLLIDGKGISQQVTILPLLVHLQTFEVSHLPFPAYDAGTTLPLLSTLKKLKLRAVPIQWMVAGEFKHLEECTIVYAIGQESIQDGIDLPCCKAFTYQGYPISTLQYFHAPQVEHMVLNSHDTNGKRALQQLYHLFRPDGRVSQLHTLHLTLQCSEKGLVKVLKYVEHVQELFLSIAYPSSKWAKFLASLVAEPSSKNWEKSWNKQEWKGWCSSQLWHVNVLPHLKHLHIRCSKGFSKSECFDNFPLLRLIAWSRAQLMPPLEHLEVWEGRGATKDVLVDYISTGYLDKYLGTTSNVYEQMVVRGMVTQHLIIAYHLTPLFQQLHSTILFRQLQGLQFYSLDNAVHILPYLKEIKELKIHTTRIPVYPLDIVFPCARTLQRLELFGSTISWMIGRTFKALQEFTFQWRIGTSEEDLSGYKGQQVNMPACTKFECWWGPATYSFISCPNVQSFQVVTDLTLGGLDEGVLKSLHEFLLKSSCLQELKITIDYDDSLIQFVLCGAQEQGVWKNIMSVEMKIWVSPFGPGYQSFNEMITHQQCYQKWWKEFTVTQESFPSPGRTLLRACRRNLDRSRALGACSIQGPCPQGVYR